MKTIATLEKCTLRKKGTKVSFWMKEGLAKDFKLLQEQKPLYSKSKLLNEATALLLLKYEVGMRDMSDIPLLNGTTSTAKRPTKKKSKPAKKVGKKK